MSSHRPPTYAAKWTGPSRSARQPAPYACATALQRNHQLSLKDHPSETVPSLSHGRKRRVWRWAALFVVLAISATAVIGVRLYQRHRHGSDYLRSLEAIAESRERTAVTALAQQLENAESLDPAGLVSLDLSSTLFQQAAAQFEGIVLQFSVPKIGPLEVRVRSVRTEFRDGFSRLRAEGDVTARGQVIPAQGLALLEPELLPGTVLLRVRCLGLAPEGNSLPGWAGTIAASAATKAINDSLEKHPIVIPLQRAMELKFSPRPPIEQPVKTNDGHVYIQIDLPHGQPIKRWLHPRVVFFTSDGLHVLAELADSEPRSIAVLADQVVADHDIAPLLARWRLAPGQSFRARVGRELLLSLLQEVNRWPDAARTVSFHGLREDGHLIDKTSGAPFGQGFSAWLDSPERLNGAMMLKTVEPVWQPEAGRLGLKVTASSEGSVRVRVRGNPPKILGHRVGDETKSDNSGGISVGGRVPQQDSTLMGAAQLNPDANAFEIVILEPATISFRVDIAGVPDALNDLFKVGFKVPLPRERPLYRFALPSIIANTIVIPISKKAGGGERRLDLQAGNIKTSLDASGLQLSGDMQIVP